MARTSKTSKTSKTRIITTRVEPELRQAFYEKCQEYSLTPSDISREFILAYVEGRLSISPPTGIKNLYNL